MVMRLNVGDLQPTILSLVVSGLRERGFVVEETWTRRGSPIEPARADAWVLKMDGRQLLAQRGRTMTVDNDGERGTLALKMLMSAGLLRRPSFGVAIACLVAYGFLQLFVMARLSQMGGVFAGLMLGAYVLLLAGYVTAAVGVDGDHPRRNMGWAVGMMAPDVVLTAPSSLLHIPLFRQLAAAVAYRRATSCGEPGAGTPGIS
jgi:hypothetical protein